MKHTHLQSRLFLILTVLCAIAYGNTDKLETLCDSLCKAIPHSEFAPRLAVLPFDNKTGNENTDYGTALAEFIIGHLFTCKSIILVDRIDFKKVIREINFSRSGFADEQQVLEMGKALSADYILTGSITDLFGQYRINTKILNTESTEIVAHASAVIAPVTLDGVTEELLGERTQVSSSILRSIVVPGWGQLYTGHYVRGGISLAAGAGSLGYTIYAIVKTRNARIDRDEWREYMDTEEYQHIRKTTEETWEDGINKYKVFDREYGKHFDRAVIAGIITGGIWTFNVVDALIAGVQSKRKFEPYFSINLRGKSEAGVCVRF
jgi:TolB-like protein